MSRIAHLRGGGVSLLLDARGEGLPRIAHWGADLGPSADPDASIPPVAQGRGRRCR